MQCNNIVIWIRNCVDRIAIADGHGRRKFDLGCWPKDLERPAEDVMIFPVTMNTPLPPAQIQNVAFQEVLSDTDCILMTFSLGLSVPTLRWCSRLRSTI